MRGMPVTDDATQSIAGVLHDILINPDTGRILGFFVIGNTVMTDRVFLSVSDILSIATRVHIRSSDALSPPEDLIRLKSALQDPRTFLGQRICAGESGRILGLCSDIQFDTRHFAVEWIFPRGWMFMKQPIAASEILEVTEEAIWVEDPLRRAPTPDPSPDGEGNAAFLKIESPFLPRRGRGVGGEGRVRT